MPTHYEWDIESIDEDGEILDHHHEDSIGAFSSFVLRQALMQQGTRLVLVRNNPNGGRLWAYVTNRELPTHFSNCDQVTEVTVPKIFAQEFKEMLDALD